MFLKKGDCIFGGLMHIIKRTSVSGAWAYVMGTKENSRIRTGAARDVILGDVLISFVGRSQVNVENYRSILIYTDTLIKLQARNCRVVIHGARLKIDYYTAEEMKITGQIGSLEFET